MSTEFDLFAGLGGWSTGACNAGIDVIWAANHCSVTDQWYSANHPDAIHICQDLHQAWPRLVAKGIRRCEARSQGAPSTTHCDPRLGRLYRLPNSTGLKWC
jgi:DNA (cytosine-5)-methyltransferase 1